MMTRLRSIVWKQARDYEVTFDVDGTQRQCICTIIEDGLVEAEPEILTKLGIWPRLAAAAVCAFDEVRTPDE